MTQSAWWGTLYDDLLADMLLERADPGQTAQTIEFLEGVLQVAPGQRVFDQCCGIGSLAVPMARRGYDVVGVDQAARYVERASEAAADAGTDPAASDAGGRARFYAADAGQFATEEPCDGGFNWWTSFGYSPDDRENLQMLLRARDSLRPGARFALDTMNLAGVLRGFQRDWVVRRSTPAGEVVLVRESRVDLEAGMMRKVWTYFVPGGETVVRRSSVRLYLPHALLGLFEEAGFDELALYGSTAGDPLDLDSPRCIAVGRRRG